MKTVTDRLEIGQRVAGTHIFGNKYVGTIFDCRWHTMDRNRMVVFVKFDAPTDLGSSPSMKSGDIRDSICVEVYPPEFDGDTKWQDGHGSSLEVIA